MLHDVEAISEVQSVLDELGYENIPRKYSAAKTDFGPEPNDATVTSVDFEYGALQVMEAGGSVLVNFTFESVEDVPSSEYRSIPIESIPAESDAWLYGHENGTLLYRTATPDERDNVQSLFPDGDLSEASIYTHEDTDRFFVERTDEKSLESDETDPTSYHVSIENELVTPAPESSDGIGTRVVSGNPVKEAAERIARQFAKSLGWNSLDGVTDECAAAIGGCLDGLWSTVDCYKCRPVCALGLTGKAAVVCFLCVGATCVNLKSASGCATAARCVDRNE
ncbi:hypothetical protein C482_19491 [Natrialba chahannaoensis JCM 10990]|uniref:Uncharacterized protein n=1 Tax=Natrialba chahannaoensis JCM 10990 TaxID=1227492 RepID=M0A342_9EURY|nr:hypothetical protein C482_19491 [Natrialba chahannaoensis JCM 10990]